MSRSAVRVRSSALSIRLRCQIVLVGEEGCPNELPGEVRAELVRIMREALTYARHHSRAKSVMVTLNTEGGELVVEISDDGHGFDPEAAPGVGLSSLQRQAAIIGAKLEIDSVVGEGTSVRL